MPHDRDGSTPFTTDDLLSQSSNPESVAPSVTGETGSRHDDVGFQHFDGEGFVEDLLGPDQGHGSTDPIYSNLDAGASRDQLPSDGFAGDGASYPAGSEISDVALPDQSIASQLQGYDLSQVGLGDENFDEPYIDPEAAADLIQLDGLEPSLDAESFPFEGGDGYFDPHGDPSALDHGVPALEDGQYEGGEQDHLEPDEVISVEEALNEFETTGQGSIANRFLGWIKHKPAIAVASFGVPLVAAGAAFLLMQDEGIDDPAQRLALVQSLGGGVALPDGAAEASDSPAPATPSGADADAPSPSPQAAAPAPEPILPQADSTANKPDEAKQAGATPATRSEAASDATSDAKVAADVAQEGKPKDTKPQEAKPQDDQKHPIVASVPEATKDNKVATEANQDGKKQEEPKATTVASAPPKATLPPGLLSEPLNVGSAPLPPVPSGGPIIAAERPPAQTQKAEAKHEPGRLTAEQVIAMMPRPPGYEDTSVGSERMPETPVIHDEPFFEPVKTVQADAQRPVAAVKGETVRLITVVSTAQLGLERFAEDHIVVRNNGQKMVYHVDDRLPNGERIQRIEIASMTLITDRSLIRIKN